MTLLTLAVMLAGSVVAARVAIDHGVAVTTAIAVRSVATAVVVGIIACCSGVSVRMTARQRCVMPVIGALVAVQSLCLYAAVARLPVGLALLAFNSYPLWTAAIAWALYRSRPARATLFAMPVILAGLALALDAFGVLSGARQTASTLIDGTGVALATVAALCYACALVLTQHEVNGLDGRIRSITTMLVVGVLASGYGLLEHSLRWPVGAVAWCSLAMVSVLYGSAITLLFTLLPKLGVVGNSPILTVEPVAALALAWLFLGQHIAPVQLAGVALVVGAVMFVGWRRR